MLAKPITYKDPFTDTERTETFYFNFTEAEIAEQELAAEGTLKEQLEAIVAASRGREIIEAFKRIIFESYGVRTETGGFRKSKALSEEFMSSAAYSALFMELLEDPNAALQFIEQIMPAARRGKSNQPKAPTDYKPSARELAEQARQKNAGTVTDDPFQGVPRAADLQPEPAASPTPDELEAFRAWQNSQKQPAPTERAPASRVASDPLRQAIDAGVYGNPDDAWSRFNETGDPSPRTIARPPFEG